MADHPSTHDTVAKEISRPVPAAPCAHLAWRSGLRSAVERLVELGLRASAWLSGALILLVFSFVVSETLTAEESPAPLQADLAAPDHQLQSYGADALGAGARALATREAARSRDPQGEAFSWGDLAGPIWDPVRQPPHFGLLPLIVGSAKIAGIALAVGAPLGICAAIFTVVFAPRRMGELIKPLVELLAGVPTVVVGFLGLVVLAPFLQNLLGYQFRLNGFLAGVAVAVAVIPIVYTTAEDALWGVPGHLREGSLALGASRWQTTRRMLLPAAAQGIVAGVMLGLGKAIGETMIVLIISGNAPVLSLGLFAPARTMSATLATEMGTVLRGEVHYHALYALATVLFVFALAFNIGGGIALGRARGGKVQGEHR
jgi:phosphate transport system permease protein